MKKIVGLLISFLWVGIVFSMELVRPDQFKIKKKPTSQFQVLSLQEKDKDDDFEKLLTEIESSKFKNRKPLEDTGINTGIFKAKWDLRQKEKNKLAFEQCWTKFKNITTNEEK